MSLAAAVLAALIVAQAAAADPPSIYCESHGRTFTCELTCVPDGTYDWRWYLFDSADRRERDVVASTRGPKFHASCSAGHWQRVELDDDVEGGKTWVLVTYVQFTGGRCVFPVDERSVRP